VLSTTVVRRGRFEGPDRALGRAAEVAGLIDAGRGLEPLRDVRLLNVLVVGSLLLGGNLGEAGVWPERALREFEQERRIVARPARTACHRDAGRLSFTSAPSRSFGKRPSVLHKLCRIDGPFEPGNVE
jgi:hypothetical protein